MAAGLAIVSSGHSLELGSSHNPGSGFLLFWLGIVMVGLSLTLLVQTARSTEPASPPIVDGRPIRWRKLLLIVVALVAYAYVLVPLGFLLSTITLLVVLFKAVEPQRWTVAIGSAAATTAIVYTVFRIWLGAQLPAGLLAIG